MLKLCVSVEKLNPLFVIPSEVACQAVALCEGWRNLSLLKHPTPNIQH
jgi:hypothetical protein